MAKSVTKKKTPKNAEKSAAAFSSRENGLAPSDKNPSKFSPTSDAVLDTQSLNNEDGLLKLFTDCVKDMYWAEKQLVKVLPKMARSAASEELSGAILDHLEQTITHVERIEQVFGLLDKKPQAQKCDAMEGLTKEGEAIIENTGQGTPARDTGIIMASSKVEHYEIAAYTGMIRLAGKLGLEEISGILSETLAEEEESDSILSSIAEGMEVSG